MFAIYNCEPKMDNFDGHDEITFSGVGRYWLTDGQDSVDLGVCNTKHDLRVAVNEAQDNGCDTTDGWRIERETLAQ